MLIEEPMDAHAVTLAAGGSHVGLAPLGTALTEDQAAQLATYGTNPVVATDADLAGRVAALNTVLLPADVLLEERLTNLPARAALTEASTVLATDTPQRWDAGCATIATRLRVTEDQARQALAKAVAAWNQNPCPQVTDQLARIRDVRARQEPAATQTPEQRWSTIAAELDPRLPQQDDWPALAVLTTEVGDTG